jgi:hypothetical protein
MNENSPDPQPPLTSQQLAKAKRHTIILYVVMIVLVLLPFVVNYFFF